VLFLLSVLLCEGVLLGVWYLAPIYWPGTGQRLVWLVVGMGFTVAMAAITLHAMAAGAVRIAIPAVATMVAGLTYISTSVVVLPPGTLHGTTRAVVFSLFFASMAWLIFSYRRWPGYPGSDPSILQS
jgi:hypothetical protein